MSEGGCFDRGAWTPDRIWDLVVVAYAHPATGQLPFDRQIASWVALGGTLVIIGHLHDEAARDRDGRHEDHGPSAA